MSPPCRPMRFSFKPSTLRDMNVIFMLRRLQSNILCTGYSRHIVTVTDRNLASYWCALFTSLNSFAITGILYSSVTISNFFSPISLYFLGGSSLLFLLGNRLFLCSFHCAPFYILYSASSCIISDAS